MNSHGTHRDWRISGRREGFLMEDFYFAGGLRALLAELGDLLHLAARTVNGQTIGENLQGAAIYNPEVIRVRVRATRERRRHGHLARKPLPARRRDQTFGDGSAFPATHGKCVGLSRSRRSRRAH